MMSETQTLSLDDIRTDGGTQMRAAISQDTVQTYAEHIEDGSDFPPVVVFHDGEQYWLADGFHRVAAYRQAETETIPVDVRSGEKIDAVRHALQANAENGRPRTGDDLSRSYQVAVDNGLCAPHDVDAVAELLRCSRQWARRLTQAARDDRKQARDDRIRELGTQGWSQRDIAAEVGCDHATVSRVLGADRNAFAMHQCGDDDPDATRSESVPVLNPQQDTNYRAPDGTVYRQSTGSFHVSSGEVEWYTPAEFMDSVRHVMGSIDTDPATSWQAQQVVKAQRWFTKEDDGLVQTWSGNVFLNPPFSMPEVDQFARRAAEAAQSGESDQIIVLVNNATDTDWFHAMLRSCDRLCLIDGRVRFYNSEGETLQARQGQAAFYFGSSVEAFRQEFSNHGVILEAV